MKPTENLRDLGIAFYAKTPDQDQWEGSSNDGINLKLKSDEELHESGWKTQWLGHYENEGQIMIWSSGTYFYLNILWDGWITDVFSKTKEEAEKFIRI